MSVPLAPRETLIFAGRRWRILEIDDDARVISVTPTGAGKPPAFSGGGGEIHDHVVATMRTVLAGGARLSYLDGEALRMLEEARSAFGSLGLPERRIIAHGNGVLLFPWVGTKQLRTLSLALLARDLKASAFWNVIEIQDCGAEAVARCLEAMAGAPPPDGEELAERLAKPQTAKFDHILSAELMNLVTARERLDVEALPSTAASILGSSTGPRSALP